MRNGSVNQGRHLKKEELPAEQGALLKAIRESGFLYIDSLEAFRTLLGLKAY